MTQRVANPSAPRETCQGCGKGRVLMNFPLYAQKGRRERLCSVCIHDRNEAERKAWAIQFQLARWSPLARTVGHGQLRELDGGPVAKGIGDDPHSREPRTGPPEEDDR